MIPLRDAISHKTKNVTGDIHRDRPIPLKTGAKRPVAVIAVMLTWQQIISTSAIELLALSYQETSYVAFGWGKSV